MADDLNANVDENRNAPKILQVAQEIFDQIEEEHGDLSLKGLRNLRLANRSFAAGFAHCVPKVWSEKHRRYDDLSPYSDNVFILQADEVGIEDIESLAYSHLAPLVRKVAFVDRWVKGDHLVRSSEKDKAELPCSEDLQWKEWQYTDIMYEGESSWNGELFFRPADTISGRPPVVLRGGGFKNGNHSLPSFFKLPFRKLLPRDAVAEEAIQHTWDYTRSTSFYGFPRELFDLRPSEEVMARLVKAMARFENLSSVETQTRYVVVVDEQRGPDTEQSVLARRHDKNTALLTRRRLCLQIDPWGDNICFNVMETPMIWPACHDIGRLTGRVLDGQPLLLPIRELRLTIFPKDVYSHQLKTIDGLRDLVSLAATCPNLRLLILLPFTDKVKKRVNESTAQLIDYFNQGPKLNCLEHLELYHAHPASAGTSTFLERHSQTLRTVILHDSQSDIDLQGWITTLITISDMPKLKKMWIPIKFYHDYGYYLDWQKRLNLPALYANEMNFAKTATHLVRMARDLMDSDEPKVLQPTSHDPKLFELLGKTRYVKEFPKVAYDGEARRKPNWWKSEIEYPEWYGCGNGW